MGGAAVRLAGFSRLMLLAGSAPAAPMRKRLAGNEKREEARSVGRTLLLLILRLIVIVVEKAHGRDGRDSREVHRQDQTRLSHHHHPSRRVLLPLDCALYSLHNTRSIRWLAGQERDRDRWRKLEASLGIPTAPKTISADHYDGWLCKPIPSTTNHQLLRLTRLPELEPRLGLRRVQSRH